MSLATRFHYRKDTWREHWRVLTGRGAVYGDCEDFALTWAWYDAGSWLSFLIGILIHRYTFVACSTPKGESHVALYVSGKGWVDNIQRKYRDTGHMHRAGYTPWFPFPSPLILLFLVIFGAIRWISNLFSPAR